MLSPFNGRTLLELLDKRQMIFAGDSITRQMFMSMACLLYSSPNVKLVRDDVQWLVSPELWLMVKVRYSQALAVYCLLNLAELHERRTSCVQELNRRLSPHTRSLLPGP
jgi:GDSL/SGNH-like Acyl-Esterase family found in Pmr5 and Cas1p